MKKGFVWCEHCEEYHRINNCTEIRENVWLCDECLHRSYFFCDECGKWHKKERRHNDWRRFARNGNDANFFSGYAAYKNGELLNVCESCLNSYYLQCVECGNFHYEDDVELQLFELGSGFICNACASLFEDEAALG